MNIHTNPYVYVSDVVFVFTSAELVRTCFPSLMTLITYIAEPAKGIKIWGASKVFFFMEKVLVLLLQKSGEGGGKETPLTPNPPRPCYVHR